MSDEFVSERIVPVAGTFDAAPMTRGEPGLPGRFVWREQEYAVAEVLEAWKETGPCCPISRQSAQSYRKRVIRQ